MWYLLNRGKIGWFLWVKYISQLINVWNNLSMYWSWFISTVKLVKWYLEYETGNYKQLASHDLGLVVVLRHLIYVELRASYKYDFIIEELFRQLSLRVWSYRKIGSILNKNYS